MDICAIIRSRLQESVYGCRYAEGDIFWDLFEKRRDESTHLLDVMLPGNRYKHVAVNESFLQVGHLLSD